MHSNSVWPSDVVKEWLLDNLGNPVESHGKHGLHFCYDEFLVNDSKKKLYVNVEDGKRCGKWSGFKSGDGGDFIELVAKYNSTSRKVAYQQILSSFSKNIDINAVFNNIDEKKVKKEEVERIVDLPDKLYRLDKEDEYSGKYTTYLRKRGMSEEFIKDCYYSYARKYMNHNFAFHNYVILPYKDKFGKIIYWTARAVVNVEPRYYNCPMSDASNYVYNIDTESQNAVMCEGIFDSESFEDRSGISTGGKNLTDSQIQKIVAKKFEEIIIGGNNEEYIKAPKKMIENFIKLKQLGQNVLIFDWIEFSKNFKTPVNDFNQVYLNRRKKLTYEELRKYVIDSEEVAEIKYRLNNTYD